MSFFKSIVAAALFTLSCGIAHASVAAASHGHHGYGAGVSGSLKGAPSASAKGNAGEAAGRSYWSPAAAASLADPYQAFPESEMIQFQKP